MYPVPELTVFAFNRSTNAPVAGDSAHITASVRIDSSARTAIAGTAVEDSATLAPGLYRIPLTKAEREYTTYLKYWAISSTPNVQVIVLPPNGASGAGNCCCGGGLEALQNAEIIGHLQTLIDGLCPPRR